MYGVRSAGIVLAMLLSLVWAACGSDASPSLETGSASPSGEGSALPSSADPSGVSGDPGTAMSPSSVSGTIGPSGTRGSTPDGSTTSSSTAICSDDEDCDGTDACVEGACVAAPASCPAGTVQIEAGSEGEPPVCEACATGTYCAGGEAPPVACGERDWDADGNPATPCAPWTVCGDDTFVAVAGTSTTDRECDPCPEDLFSEGPNALVCTPSCTSDAQCGTGAWCATDTEVRRCAPRPVVEGVAIPFQWVPGGEFTMGSPADEVGRFENEEQVSVSLTRDFFVQRTPVTRAQWAAVMGAWNALDAEERTMSGWTEATPVFGTAPSYFGLSESMINRPACEEESCPVERVNWWDAVVFANALSLLEGLDPCYELSGCGTGSDVASVGGGCSGTNIICTVGPFTCDAVSFAGKACTGYRLLTEAEWERAARGGTTTATFNGDLAGTECETSEALLDPILWYTCNSALGGPPEENRPHPVGLKAPNSWGLHDMLGHVWEWTWNREAETQSGGEDPLGPATGNNRALRGGSWGSDAAGTRAARRQGLVPSARIYSYGFRLARSE